MPLQTQYINPDVIVTTRVTQQLRDGVKYVLCAGLILLTYFLSAYPLGTAMLGVVGTGALWWGAQWYLKRRPTIILVGQDRKIQITGITKFSKAQTIPFQLVAKVTVLADVAGRETGQYIPQLVLRGLKGTGKNLVVNCFPVEDIIQAHYAAQLLATFSRTDAFDFKGNQLPILPTHIPTRFLVGRKNELRSVAALLQKPTGQAKGAGAAK